MKPVKVGIGGPVGSGKTQLIERITRAMDGKVDTCVITNDIYTKEDAKILNRTGILPSDRIIGVETGGCPHAAIREDISMNAETVDVLIERHPNVELIFIESGGDNLAATFSPELVDFSIYIIDVAQGEKIPRKGGQGMIKSDLFIINKTDLAPYVDANLDIMASDTKKFRGDKPFFFTNLKTDDGLEDVVNWIEENVLLKGLKVHG
ncbi:urease accessory protein UreG [Marixanthomonas spongiae]|uniref:Urease accessory protein UreG n=1 Tax=Marixanthomonas spongiae TaxID=2174845 RepID=A0A2U0I0L5_9FLAO|nr:urease accessory protein UreG [Marixanthomonas spongiae]PVW14639.1 urease accessory protein UreG [Marixanthomonas spongiae]